MASADNPRKIAIVGGGFSGVCTALHLLRQEIANPSSDEPLQLTIFEKEKQRMCGGIAYGMAGPEHYTNIPARMISPFPDRPGDVADWLKERSEKGWRTDSGNRIPGVFRGQYDEHSLVPRRLYQIYLQDRLDAARTEAAIQGVAEVKTVFADVKKVSETENGRARVVSKSKGHVFEGSETFDHVVLATGHLEQKAAPFMRNVSGHTREKRCVEDIWEGMSQVGQFATNPKVKTIGVIGTGLSGYDAVLTAKKLGYFDDPNAQMLLISRNGHTHAPMGRTDVPFPKITRDDLPATPTRVQDVPGYVNKVFDQYRKQGFEDWTIVASMRPLVPSLIKESGIPAGDLSKLLSKHSSLVGVTSIGVGAVVADQVQELVDRGQVKILAASIHNMHQNYRGELEMRVTRAGQEQPETLKLDRLVTALGPTSDYTKTGNGLARRLRGAGMILPDPETGVGIEVGPTRRLVDSHGRELSSISAVGPMTAGDAMTEEGKFGPAGQNIPGIRDHVVTLTKSLAPKPGLDLDQDGMNLHKWRKRQAETAAPSNRRRLAG